MIENNTIKRIIVGREVFDGAGVRLNRVIATPEVDNIDPFFLLDEFRSDNSQDYIAGFPMHPHRGIETITYMVKGSFRHKDSRGGGGVLNSGEVQWMTAGRGIQHEEIPEMKEGVLWGYQLWLNLPKKDKWAQPRYQHLTADIIPQFSSNSLKVIVISGKYESIIGPAQNLVPCTYFDVSLRLEGAFHYHLPTGHNSMIYVHTGVVEISGETFPAKNLIEFHSGVSVEIRSSSKGAGFLFLSARPNNEPFSRGGPFVMNTREEILQAFEDYRNGRLF